MNIAVVGAGMVGLWSALALTRRGARVQVFDAGAVAGEASWAGGGILCPLWPWSYPDGVCEIALRGARLWREELERTSREREAGLIRSSMTVNDRCDQAEQWARRFELPLRLLAGDRVNLPTIDQVRTPRAGRVLGELATAAGVRIHCSTRVELTGAGARGTLRVAGRDLTEFDQILICAGAWSGKLLEEIGVSCDIHPVRGQMIALKGRATSGAIVLQDGRYLVPRSETLVLCGSTMENAGFDRSTTAAGRRELVEAAVNMDAGLATAEVVHHWAGLRPGSPDGVPEIGRVGGYDNLWVNIGHHRNGVAMAPATAQILADRMLTELTS